MFSVCFCWPKSDSHSSPNARAPHFYLLTKYNSTLCRTGTQLNHKCWKSCVHKSIALHFFGRRGEGISFPFILSYITWLVSLWHFLVKLILFFVLPFSFVCFFFFCVSFRLICWCWCTRWCASFVFASTYNFSFTLQGSYQRCLCSGISIIVLITW